MTAREPVAPEFKGDNLSGSLYIGSMRRAFTIFSIAVSFSSMLAFAQGFDVSQSAIHGSGPASEFGLPFAQSFRAENAGSLSAIYLAVVSSTGAADVSLFRTDPTGSALTGDAVASGSITEAEIRSFEGPLP